MTTQGFTPHPDQRRVIDLVEKGEEKYFVLTTGRQWGKTLLGINLMIKWALEGKDLQCLWVSPVYSQCKKVFEQLSTAVGGTPVVSSINKSDLEVKFINGSKIFFRSGDREDTLRGYTLDYLIIDEAAFLKEVVWNTVLKQTVMVKGKKVLFISTPKGKNFLYSLHIRGVEEDQKNYKSLKGTSFDTPFISSEELKEAKKSLPEDVFRQEIMAEFIENGGEVFSSTEEYCVLESWLKLPEKKYYAGIDFGRQNDYTVLTILDEDGNCSFIYRERQKPWAEIVDNLVKYLNEYKAIVQCEVNSIGDVLFEQLKKRYPKSYPFQTTSASKQNIIEDLLYTLNEGQMKLPSPQFYPHLSSELSTYSYTYNMKSRQIRYSAADGAHDDIVMSLAIAFNTLKSKRRTSAYKIY
jgi:phage terminase large subunit